MRTTHHLDLTSETAQSQLDRETSEKLLYKALHKRQKIVVVAGAGISVSAGIPDFRSSHGLFRSLRGEHKLKSSGKALFDASVYKDDDSTSNFHDMVRKLSKMAADAKPSRFHNLLARLAKEGRLLRLYTQNVDGLETMLPPLKTQVPLNLKAPWPRTIQLHGGLEKMNCQKCGWLSDFDSNLFEGPVPPDCPICIDRDLVRTTHAGKRSHGVGKLRPRMVLYNESNPDQDAIGNVTTADFRTRPDAVIVVGTSMKIPTVRRIVHEMCSIVRDRKEGTTIWINPDPAPTGKDLENLWDLIVTGDSDDVATLAKMPQWHDDSMNVAESYTESDVERVRSSQGQIKVEVKTPKEHHFSHVDLGPAVMTPPLSPRFKHVDIEEDDSRQPMKFTVEIPPKKPNYSTLKNPASEGRKLSDVISRDSKVKSNISLNKNPVGRPPKITGKKAQAMHGQQRLILKVTKPPPQQSAVAVKPKPQPLSPRRDSNTQVLPAKIETFQEYSSTEGSPMPETPPEMMRQTPPAGLMRSPSQQETISPKGTVPRDMLRLLN